MDGTRAEVDGIARVRSLPKRIAGYAFLVCAAWPVTLGVLWLTTGRTVPTVHVRWVPGTTVAQRKAAERELALVWHEPMEPGTVRYFVPEASTQNLERVVVHPLVEDTAFVNRATFVLEDSPLTRMWIGDRFTTPWPAALLYVSVAGCLISAVVRWFRD